MYTEFDMHGVVKITSCTKVRENYTVTYIIATDFAGNTHTSKLFHDASKLGASILETLENEYNDN